MKTNLFTKTLVIAFTSLLAVTSCDDKDELICTNGKVYLADNGKTIIACPDAQIGDTGVVNGVTYTIVDEATLREMVEAGEDITQVCTSKITDMSLLFYDLEEFNQDISNWDVSNVTNMFGIFSSTPFNQDIRDWDVSNVTNMNSMFAFNASFNQNISSWDVSNVANMSSMFQDAGYFNQDISNWDVSNVIDMSYMLYYAENFNQDLSSWNVEMVTDCAAFSESTQNWELPKPNFTNCSE